MCVCVYEYGGECICVSVCMCASTCMCMGYSSHIKRSQDSLKCQPSVSMFSEPGSLVVHTVSERLADPRASDQSSAPIVWLSVAAASDFTWVLGI